MNQPREQNGTDARPQAGEGKEWVKQDTAILVIHGIGNQKPLDTLDQFGRSLVESFSGQPDAYKLSHRLAERSAGGDSRWYENFIRIERPGEPSGHHLDLYEYYWANQPQNLAEMGDINRWLHKVATEAKRFYQRNKVFAEKEESSFFVSKGKFNIIRYWFILNIAARVIPFLQKVWYLPVYLLSKIPVVGKLFYGPLEMSLLRVNPLKMSPPGRAAA